MAADLIAVPYLLGVVLEVWAGPALAPAVSALPPGADIAEVLLDRFMVRNPRN